MNFIKYKVVIRKEAHNDIFNFMEYIYKNSFDINIARNIGNILYEKIFSLNFMPQMYQKVLGDYRVALVKKVYKIFYKLEKDKVIIVRVIRTEQNINDLILK